MTLEERVRALLRDGDRQAAATAVIEAYGPAILRYLRSLLREEDDAADAFSQWAEDVWEGLPAFRFGASLKTWCYRIAWNAAQNLRNQAWRRRGERLVTGQASQLAQSIRTRSALVAERQRQALERLRAALEPAEQSLLVLRIDHELSWAEVAEVLGAEGARAEPAALMKRFERIKAKLTAMARKDGLLDEDPAEREAPRRPKDPPRTAPEALLPRRRPCPRKATGRRRAVSPGRRPASLSPWEGPATARP
jgi:RNA polymerase sigma-70 factor (ECF subfamily)